MSTDHEMAQLFSNFVEERHRVWEKRQRNEDAPWTDDPVIANKKFTNCFRVLDRGSQFVVKDLMIDRPHDYLARCIFYRITNLPATWGTLWNELGGQYPVAEDFTHRPDTLFRILDDRRSNGHRVFSGAYIIIPEPGTKRDKIAGAINLTKRFMEERANEFFDVTTQAKRYSVLRSMNGLGPFLSMQILTDWGYGESVNRENEFIVAGPGSRRGAAHVNPDVKPEHLIQETKEAFEDNPVVNINGHPLSLMDVQNCYCEFSKYVRYLDRGETYGPPYSPDHPGYQPPPVLPSWLR